MTDVTFLALLLIVWVLAISFVVYRQLRHGVIDAGLVFAYLFQLALIHFLGAMVRILPWYISPPSSLTIVNAGFEQATYGLLSFVFALYVLVPVILKVLNIQGTQPAKRSLDPRLPKIYLAIGLFSYFILSPIAGSIPTLPALVAASSQLMLVGICLGVWQAWHSRQRGPFVGWLVLATGLPFLTILTQGFLGYGVAALATVLAFMSVFVHPRWRLLVAGLFMTYLGLSFYVTYFRDRTELRVLVWGGLPFTDRVVGVLNTVQNIEWFNPFNQEHLDRIDGRLNQNYLAGVAVIRLQSGAIDYADGETIWDATLALVPRVFWPDKPTVAGSGNIVNQYTGIPFAQGTSIGVGQVMEFFINFGTPGIVVGFLLLGCVVGTLDFGAGQRLRQQDWEGMALWFLPGLALLQTGGALVELTGTAGASIVAVLFINRIILPFLRARQPISDHVSQYSEPEII